MKDTNNNSPVFTPNDNFEFTIAPPLMPGYEITGCNNDILVRDIDLTTNRIDFGLTGSDYFEIVYDTSPEPKQFSAILRTTTFIRSLPEPIELTISATVGTDYLIGTLYQRHTQELKESTNCLINYTFRNNY